LLRVYKLLNKKTIKKVWGLALVCEDTTIFELAEKFNKALTSVINFLQSVTFFGDKNSWVGYILFAKAVYNWIN